MTLRMLIACSALLLPACAPRAADLEPAHSATWSHDDRALDREDGVVLVAEAESWPGNALVTQRVTPLRITIQNQGLEPIRIRYADLRLFTGADSRQALPTIAIEGEVDVLDEQEALREAGFEQQRFAVASAYGPVYPGMSVVTAGFPNGRSYYRSRSRYWDVEESLPTPEMKAGALPEGILETGGKVRGWVYFDKLRDDGGATLEAKLARVDAAGEPSAPVTLRIPFVDR